MTSKTYQTIVIETKGNAAVGFNHKIEGCEVVAMGLGNVISDLQDLEELCSNIIFYQHEAAFSKKLMEELKAKIPQGCDIREFD